MRRIVSILFLLWSASAFGAAGDYIGAQINPEGWQLWLEFSGMNTNGTFNLGFSSDPKVTNTCKVIVDVRSQGFDDTGTAITLSRRLYGTKQVRFAGVAFPDVVSNVTSTTIKLSLSDFVYMGDSNITVTVSSGLYSTNSVTNAAVSAVPVTNNSVHAYPQVVGNWSWRGFRVIDSANMTLRAVAYNQHAKNGRPIRMAEFRAKDSANTWFTNRQTVMKIDRTMGDANPVPEYIADFPTNVMASGFVTGDVRFYPWVGDSTSILDSAVTGNSEPSPQLCTITNAVLFNRVRARVNRSSGSDTTGVAASELYWSTNNNPAKFQTIGGAIIGIYNTNSSIYSRSGWDGGIVYLETGNYGWWEKTVTLANGPSMELLITPWPGETPVITNRVTDVTGTTDKDIYRLKGPIDMSGNGIVVANFLQAWFENVTLHDWPANQWLDSGVVANSMILTGCTISNMTFQGLQASATDNSFFTLIRGNTIKDGCKQMTYVTCLGNNHTSPSGDTFGVKPDYSSMSANLRGHPTILGYNTFYGITNVIVIQGFYDVTNGMVLANNIFEYCITNETSASSLKLNTLNATNVIVWNNCFFGNRWLTTYNDTGSTPIWSYDWSIKNNIFDWGPVKSDLFAPANSARTGNWAQVWSVGNSGDAWLFMTNMNGTSSFHHDFPGLGSIEVVTPGDALNTTNYYQMVQKGGFDGVTVQPSPGLYRSLSTSPLLLRNVTEWVLPFDLDGSYRGGYDPPGPYSSATPKKGSGFFSQ